MGNGESGPRSYGQQSSFSAGNHTEQGNFGREHARAAFIPDNFSSLDQVISALREYGLESSNLILGIDFTKSNEWTGKHSFNRRSLHAIGGTPNPYEQAISIIGRTLSPFDEDNLIPCFGFGDASTHDQYVFSFYPDHHSCRGFEEVLARYREIVPFIKLSVICCLVDGRVIALNSKGSVVWEVVTGGPVFAGACMSYALPSQVLVCSRNGSIYSFESESGDPVWEYQVGDPVTSSAYINEHIQLISKPSDVIHRLVCVCSSSGSIRVLRIRSDAAQQRRQLAQDVMGSGMVEEMARMDLPADIFSSPVMVGGLLFVGCRDDHVRCINTIPDELLSDSRNPLSLD